MKKENIYRSPVIYYEIEEDNNSYHLDVYIEGHKNSPLKNLHCKLSDFTNDIERIHCFARNLSENAALPVHIPELAEEFLSF